MLIHYIHFSGSGLCIVTFIRSYFYINPFIALIINMANMQSTTPLNSGSTTPDNIEIAALLNSIDANGSLRLIKTAFDIVCSKCTQTENINSVFYVPRRFRLALFLAERS